MKNLFKLSVLAFVALTSSLMAHGGGNRGERSFSHEQGNRDSFSNDRARDTNDFRRNDQYNRYDNGRYNDGFGGTTIIEEPMYNNYQNDGTDYDGIDFNENGVEQD